MAIQSLFPPYPDPVVEDNRLMRRSWVGFFQGWIAAWDALLLSVADLTASVAALYVERPGPTVDVAYNPSNFSTDSGGLWMVEFADQVTFQYKLVGDWMTVNLFIYTTSVSGPASGVLQVTIPNGYVAKQTSVGSAWALDNNVSIQAHYAVLLGVPTVIQFAPDAGGTWDNTSVNGTAVGACVSFQIVRP